MERPKCKRCGGPLDVVYEPETKTFEWHCNNLAIRHTPMFPDAEFERRWNELDGDTVARLTRERPEVAS